MHRIFRFHFSFRWSVWQASWEDLLSIIATLNHPQFNRSVQKQNPVSEVCGRLGQKALQKRTRDPLEIWADYPFQISPLNLSFTRLTLTHHSPQVCVQFPTSNFGAALHEDLRDVADSILRCPEAGLPVSSFWLLEALYCHLASTLDILSGKPEDAEMSWRQTDEWPLS